MTGASPADAMRTDARAVVEHGGAGQRQHGGGDGDGAGAQRRLRKPMRRYRHPGFAAPALGRSLAPGAGTPPAPGTVTAQTAGVFPCTVVPQPLRFRRCAAARHVANLPPHGLRQQHQPPAAFCCTAGDACPKATHGTGTTSHCRSPSPRRPPRLPYHTARRRPYGERHMAGGLAPRASYHRPGPMPRPLHAAAPNPPSPRCTAAIHDPGHAHNTRCLCCTADPDADAPSPPHPIPADHRPARPPASHRRGCPYGERHMASGLVPRASSRRPGPMPQRWHGAAAQPAITALPEAIHDPGHASSASPGPDAPAAPQVRPRTHRRRSGKRAPPCPASSLMRPAPDLNRRPSHALQL